MNVCSRKTMIVAGLFLATATLPQVVSAYDTDKCGPMCHNPAAFHSGSEGSWKGLGPRDGTLQDMKRHFRIGAGQEASWEAFQKALFDRMLATFDAQNLTQEGATATPADFDPETMAPVLSVELIEKWQNVLTTFDDLKQVLDQDRQRVADRIRTICKQVE
ncbi:MAG: hypothetical protein HQL52_11175 [Magnetococcales bacterium]|nr:hypothetical protein [Magnetococcales bacterium]